MFIKANCFAVVKPELTSFIEHKISPTHTHTHTHMKAQCKYLALHTVKHVLIQNSNIDIYKENQVIADRLQLKWSL